MTVRHCGVVGSTLDRGRIQVVGSNPSTLLLFISQCIGLQQAESTGVVLTLDTSNFVPCCSPLDHLYPPGTTNRVAQPISGRAAELTQRSRNSFAYTCTSFPIRYVNFKINFILTLTVWMVPRLLKLLFHFSF